MKLAIISDIHEDVVNLKQALHKIEKAQCDEIFCLGDISGFCVPHYHYYDTRNAHECLRIIRENCKIILAGNHDLHAAQKLPVCSPEFVFPDDWYSLDYYERETLSNNTVWLYDENELNPLYSKEDIEFLKILPEQYISREVLFSHYFFPNLTGVMKKFYHKSEEIQGHLRFLEENSCKYGFTGHFHPNGLFIGTKDKTFIKRYNKKYFLTQPTCISVPPITGKKIGNGFCIFDTNEGWVKAVRV